jgi:hypothetical protein
MQMSLTRNTSPDSQYVKRSADRVVLYLDLDGVVQHHAVLWHHRRGIFMCPKEAPGRRLFEWLGHLEEALAPYPDVALVLSSTWCIRPGYGKTLKYFPAQLRQRFVGGTYHKRVHGADPWASNAFKMRTRAQQILVDVARRQPSHWLALDDDIEDWPAEHRHNLVACDGTTGLSDPRVRAELAAKLADAHGLSFVPRPSP